MNSMGLLPHNILDLHPRELSLGKQIPRIFCFWFRFRWYEGTNFLPLFFTLYHMSICRMVDFFLKCDKIKKIINFIFFFPALKGQYTQLLVQYEELKAGVSIVQEKNTPLYFCKLARLLSYQQLQAFLLTWACNLKKSKKIKTKNTKKRLCLLSLLIASGK